MMKKRVLSGILAALIAAGTLPVFTASAKADRDFLREPVSDIKVLNAFEKQKPELKITRKNSSQLEWTEVNGAFYYEVYRHIPNWDGEYGKEWYSYGAYLGRTCDFGGEDAQYRVRAVIFSDDGKKHYSSFSNIVTYDKDNPVFDDEKPDSSQDEFDEFEYEDETDFEQYEFELLDNEYPNKAPAAETVTDIPLFDPGAYVKNNGGNGYKDSVNAPVSVFPAYADTVSYSELDDIIYNSYAGGIDGIPADAVRTEELINYFDYGYKKPSKSDFTIDTELSDCPWNKSAQVLKIGIQGKDFEKTPASNIVFLVDTGGSMGSMEWGRSERLCYARYSIEHITSHLTENDRVSIVTYSEYKGVLLAGARGDHTNTVSAMTSFMDEESIYELPDNEGGILEAYEIAEKYYIEGGNNRIIMMTGGDLNVGIYGNGELKKLIKEKCKRGIYFSVMGFEEDNIRNSEMEVLAGCGNGNYRFAGNVDEAYRFFCEERGRTFPIAEDVKLQAEFDPENVKCYRLIGYDDCRFDSVKYNSVGDTEDVGAGQHVTVLYEIIPAEKTNSDELVTVRINYKKPESGESKEITKTVDTSVYSEEMSDGMKLSCAAAEFGMALKGSRYKGSSTVKGAQELVLSIKDPDDSVKEFINLFRLYFIGISRDKE